MENNTTKKSSTIPIMGMFMLILACSVGWLISANCQLRRENKEKTEQIEKLKQNQKPETELYNESNKPCAGC